MKSFDDVMNCSCCSWWDIQSLQSWNCIILSLLLTDSASLKRSFWRTYCQLIQLIIKCYSSCFLIVLLTFATFCCRTLLRCFAALKFKPTISLNKKVHFISLNIIYVYYVSIWQKRGLCELQIIPFCFYLKCKQHPINVRIEVVDW